MEIEPEKAEQFAAIRALLCAAFATATEADLVEQLRRDGDAVIALSATDEGRVVGYVMLSRMRAPFRALGLAPVAVDAGARRRGVAAALIEEAIRRARTGGYQAIFVVGDPAYYGRFGFSAGAALPFQSPHAGPHLMLLALDESACRTAGRVHYAPAFAAFE